MLKKGAEADWNKPTEEELEAFQEPQKVLLHPPMIYFLMHEFTQMMETENRKYFMGVKILRSEEPEFENQFMRRCDYGERNSRTQN